MSFTVGDIVTEILSSPNSAFDIALKYNVLPQRNQVLHCPNCNHEMKYNVSTEKWKCHNYKCSTSRSCTYPFNIPKNHFPKFLACIFLYAADIPISQAIKLYNISSQIIDRNYFQLREKVHMSYVKKMQERKLSFHVQIDESAFGKRKYNRGRTNNGVVWVFGACDAQRGGDVYMIPVVKRDEEHLIPIIQSWCPQNGIINSDCWAAYNNLDQYGFDHYTVNHSQNFVNPITEEHTQRIESLWNSAKNFLRNHHYNYHVHLEKYIAEWCFRYNNKYDTLRILKELSKIN